MKDTSSAAPKARAKMQIHCNHGGLDPCPQRVWDQYEETALFPLSHPIPMYLSVPLSPDQPVFMINFVVTDKKKNEPSCKQWT